MLRINLVNPTYIDPCIPGAAGYEYCTGHEAWKRHLLSDLPIILISIPNLRPNRNKNNFYFNGNIDLSMNIAGIVSGANVQKTGVQKTFSQCSLFAVYQG